MLDLYKNIKKLRLQMQWSQDELAKRAGYTDRSSIAKIEKGQVDLPQSKILLFADIFRVTPGELMGNDGIDDILSKFPNIHPITTQRFPVLGSVSCGEPKFMDEEIDVYVDASEEIKADFVLRAKGDSMIGARIYDGDLVFVRKQDIVENGEIAVVAIDDEATLKRFYKYGELIVLRAENPAYKDQEYTPEQAREIRVLGKAVSFQSVVK